MKIGILSSVLTLIAAIIAGWLFIDERYAKAGDVGMLEIRMIARINSLEYAMIDREIDAISDVARTRDLTSIEKARLKRLKRDLASMSAKWHLDDIKPTTPHSVEMRKYN